MVDEFEGQQVAARGTDQPCGRVRIPSAHVTAMTPQETYDAVNAFVTTGEREGFDRMCEQLRTGVLVMEWGEDGLLIRAATT